MARGLWTPTAASLLTVLLLGCSSENSKPVASGAGGAGGAGSEASGGVAGVRECETASTRCDDDPGEEQTCEDGAWSATTCPAASPRCVADACATVVGLASGLSEGHSCVILDRGGLACWGRNSAGQLGLGTTTLLTGTPTLSRLPGVDAACLGRTHTCAVHEGRLSCWGDNADGQAGLGDLERALEPTEVALVGEASGVACGWRHSCVLLASGAVWCTGAGEYGQLGDGTASGSSEVVQVSGLNDATGLVVGTEHGCALRGDQTVVCWGRGQWGQLGDGRSGDSVTSALPVQVLKAPSEPLGSVRSLTSGAAHTCAVTDDDALWCWGRNHRGAFGLGTTSDQNPFARSTGYVDVVGASSGLSHLCVSTRAGTVLCSGWNAHGQVGFDSAGTDVDQPYSLPLLGVTQVSSQGAHGCAILGDGTVWCWGWNGYAQLGFGFGGQMGQPPGAVVW